MSGDTRHSGEHGFDPRPKSNEETWKAFIKRHGETLWQCDFFSKSIWTWTGRKQFFVLAFLHVSTRKVFVTPCTLKPNNDWMKQQTAAFVEHAKTEGLEPGLVMRDGDVIYRSGFEDTLADAGFTTKRITFRSPNLNSFVERWVQSIQQECLDHFIVFGEKHFDYLISEYVDYFHTERPHQSLENKPLVGHWPEPDDLQEKLPDGEIVCRCAAYFRTRS